VRSGHKHRVSRRQPSPNEPGLFARLADSTGGVSLARVVGREAAVGDEREFLQLVEPVLPAAHRLAVGLLRSPSDADDAVQSALLNAWRHFGRFRPGSDLKPWLLTIVANECRRQRRNRWWSVIKGPGGAADRSESGMTDPAVADLRRALHRLPHHQRLVVILRYYLDLSFDEVAQTLGISTKAAKSRTYRALERLRLSPEVRPDE
jgi:RNA polymerase sigma-70 factor, ECF subfamily